MRDSNKVILYLFAITALTRLRAHSYVFAKCWIIYMSIDSDSRIVRSLRISFGLFSSPALQSLSSSSPPSLFLSLSLRFLFLSLNLFDLSCLPSHSREAIRSLSGRCLRFPAIAWGEPVALHSDRIRTVLFLFGYLSSDLSLPPYRFWATRIKPSDRSWKYVFAYGRRESTCLETYDIINDLCKWFIRLYANDSMSLTKKRLIKTYRFEIIPINSNESEFIKTLSDSSERLIMPEIVPSFTWNVRF